MSPDFCKFECIFNDCRDNEGRSRTMLCDIKLILTLFHNNGLSYRESDVIPLCV